MNILRKNKAEIVCIGINYYNLIDCINLNDYKYSY